MYSIGLDIGSTTAKIVVFDYANDFTEYQVVLSKYERHFSRAREKCIELLKEAKTLVGNQPCHIAISGSAGMGLANAISIPFIQEVFATSDIIRNYEPDVNCVIELGGEDAKIIFFDGGIDERMNGSCAGGTGAFIDQMATLLNISVDELDSLSLNHKRIYPIASRCGVFAKTDIQPLLNQGARKEDIAASIYQAVVSQTIAGLAQGKKIDGKVVFLGGPLFYCRGLRDRFKDVLELDDSHAVFPEYGRFTVAMGAAKYGYETGSPEAISDIIQRITDYKDTSDISLRLQPLFTSCEEYQEFKARHDKATVTVKSTDDYTGNAYLGIDCGSTTTKLVLISESNDILYSFYASNQGNPLEVVKERLSEIYELCADRITIAACTTTGYGEELIKNAFSADYGIVETIAHYTAAKHFRNDVDFILDIGGQDIKCFKIKNGAIDSIMLNEACSSGCGSFLETFAKALGFTINDFAQKGLFATAPSNLGSRCTVFMNSSVKQSQKEGASVEDISAGLSISVVKNALYKVIRATSASELGENIVVQGGTFLNDAVLRAFEKELGKNVIRPSIAGLMGAYGAALYGKKQIKRTGTRSTLISHDGLKAFSHTAKSSVCNGCTNRCHLTVNIFADGRRYISGNQCEKMTAVGKNVTPLPDLYEFKRNYLTSMPGVEGKRGTVGLPLALGMYELLPLWHAIFSSLNFKVKISDMSSHYTYIAGQYSIPSDTACYPAKIMHGHIMQLLNDGVDAIFYPCLTYNIDEKEADNCYNCPIVAYYSELLAGNVDELKSTRFLYPYLNINNKKIFAKELFNYLKTYYPDVTHKECVTAVADGFAAYQKYMSAVKAEGQAALDFARANGKRIMILAGRPYHIDSEICHGIDRLARLLGFVVVSEDSIYHRVKPRKVNVLNQWTYHSRLYRAAQYAAQHADTELVQLVSFGCGVDAITTDEVRSILESNNKYYTQLKIDEITNLGAVTIRLRSLIGAIEEKEGQ